MSRAQDDPLDAHTEHTPHPVAAGSYACASIYTENGVSVLLLGLGCLRWGWGHLRRCFGSALGVSFGLVTTGLPIRGAGAALAFTAVCLACFRSWSEVASVCSLGSGATKHDCKYVQSTYICMIGTEAQESQHLNHRLKEPASVNFHVNCCYTL